MKLTRADPAITPTPRQIVEHFDRHVIGQEEAKRALALAAYAHLRRVEALRRGQAGPWRKSNVLLVGPTGSGKTLLARHLAEAMRAPFSTADATEYTEAGYYGKDVEWIVADLYARAGHSVEEAQRGVVFVDEVDKIARRSQGAQSGAGARDIGGEGVQQALLKLLEGREVQVPSGSGQPWARSENVVVDTTHVLFVCAGTFSDLHEDLSGRRPVGFGASASAGGPRRVEARDLVSFGMLAEFLGRLPVVVQLEPLGREALERILTEPEDALVREYRARFALDGVELVVRPAALRALAEQALERGFGARGLRAMMEQVCADLLFDAPDMRGGKAVVDGAYVRRRLRRLDAVSAPRRSSSAPAG
jgi:ATP-dependent Clp protease ATP-binding subunit ClpX